MIQAVGLAEQPEQQVLRTDVPVLERHRLVLPYDDDLPGAFGKPLEPRAWAGQPSVARTAAGWA
jgi:hypothetical protein